MKQKIIVALAFIVVSIAVKGDTLGFIEQKFSDLHFEKGKWSRTVQQPCYSYEALEDGATVDVLRIGMGNLVPFKATKGLKVTVCGSTAAFDEGFEAGIPVSGRTVREGNR